MSKPLFALGRCVATPGALRLLEEHSLSAMVFLRRHQCGDFGDICDEDRQANENAIVDGSRILSSYAISPTERQAFIGRVRDLARGAAEQWAEQEAERAS